MRGGVVAVLAGVALLAAAGVGQASQGCDLDDEALRVEMTKNRLMRSYIKRNGLPDVAEVRPLSNVPPWDDHLVTLYYLASHREIAFARAYILGEPSIAVFHHERTLSDDEIAALSPRARRRSGSVEGAEAAAARAEAAANRVEAAAERADHAAQRAEAVASKLESRFARRVRK